MNSNLGEKAKATLEAFAAEVDRRIGEYFDREIELGFGFNGRQKEVVKEALIHSKEIILRPQKHLRSSLVVYSYLLEGGKLSEDMWKAAMATEIVHGALLMHDDFMDQDDTRRGGITTHRYFQQKFNGDLHAGESMAVTVADAVLCMGFELLESSGNHQAIKQMLRGIVNTAYGQAYDVSLESFGNWTEEDVIALHKAKTAIYTYENPLFIGAHLAGLQKEVFDILHDYAMDGGVAFQLQDDMLGVYGTPEKTGKSADSDLKQGKCTLMVLKAIDEPAVKKVWGNMQATREELDAAKQAMMDCGAYDYNKKVAQEYAKKAAATANKLRKFKLNSEAIDYIQGVAEYMVIREV